MDEDLAVGDAHPYRAFLPVYPRPRYDQPISSAKTWCSHFDRQHAGLWLTAPGPFPSLEAFLAEARTRAEKRLDILSVMGAGHHIVPFRHRDVLAFKEEAGRQDLLIRSPHIMTVPHGFRSWPANNPEALEPKTELAAHHASMRYFRLAQVSGDPFGCFVYLYRSLEAILDEAHPFERGREKEWFQAAITKALEQCHPYTTEALGMHAEAEPFTSFVYEQVRNPLFHAKTKSRTPLAPLDLEAAQQVRAASKLITLVVVDLLKPYIPIGRGERVRSDVEMYEASELPDELQGFRLLIEGGQTAGQAFAFTGYRDDDNLGHLLVGEPLPRKHIPKAPIVGVQIVTAQGPGPRVAFDGRIDGTRLDSLSVQVFMAVDFELGHRTAGWIPEEGVRVAPRLDRPKPRA